MRSGCGRLSFAFVHGRFVRFRRSSSRREERVDLTRTRRRGAGRRARRAVHGRRCCSAGRQRAHRRPAGQPARPRRCPPVALVDARRRRPHESSRRIRSMVPRAAPTSGTAARCTPPLGERALGGPALQSGDASTRGRSAPGTKPARPSAYSAPATLETGLLTQSDLDREVDRRARERPRSQRRQVDLVHERRRRQQHAGA